MAAFFAAKVLSVSASGDDGPPSGWGIETPSIVSNDIFMCEKFTFGYLAPKGTADDSFMIASVQTTYGDYSTNTTISYDGIVDFTPPSILASNGTVYLAIFSTSQTVSGATADGNRPLQVVLAATPLSDPIVVLSPNKYNSDCTPKSTKRLRFATIVAFFATGLAPSAADSDAGVWAVQDPMYTKYSNFFMCEKFTFEYLAPTGTPDDSFMIASVQTTYDDYNRNTTISYDGIVVNYEQKTLDFTPPSILASNGTVYLVIFSTSQTVSGATADGNKPVQVVLASNAHDPIVVLSSNKYNSDCTPKSTKRLR
ncbi:hypothetical protein T439DRAFT_351569 [Meredithblackwellia eburnea MCA 4105]